MASSGKLKQASAKSDENILVSISSSMNWPVLNRCSVNLRVDTRRL